MYHLYTGAAPDVDSGSWTSRTKSQNILSFFIILLYFIIFHQSNENWTNIHAAGTGEQME